MTRGFVTNSQEWLRTYHMRSISETSNSIDKMRFPAKTRKRLPWRKNTEEFLRWDVHNLRQYSHLRYLQPHMVGPMAG